MLKRLLLLLIFISLNIFAGDIQIKDAYVRAVPPNLQNSASFMKIINLSDKTIYLQSASSNVAKNVELHEHTMSNGMMKMQQVKDIKIPAKSSVELKPGGLHVMLIGLNKKLIPDEVVTSLTLNFSNNTSITIQNVPIKTVMMGMKH
ncbi:copper chaperone PCu(A)C [Sulfurospirillum arcachonense]|uniref:copper chaperone PCu(A)C n=1 Tax=Sulfurospirillum arcachonense TaxID=57666 RepID=UPI0004AE89AA|nr:copper chaperone PCu(A)C [Sulfurospirillum arcachonense]